jgi:hypothetical protein
MGVEKRFCYGREVFGDSGLLALNKRSRIIELMVIEKVTSNVHNLQEI